MSSCDFNHRLQNTLFLHKAVYLGLSITQNSHMHIYLAWRSGKAGLFQNSTFNQAFEYSFPYLVVGGTSKGGNADVIAVLHGECVLFLELAVGKRQQR